MNGYRGFDEFLLRVGNGNNISVVQHFRDAYDLPITDFQIAVMNGDVSRVAELLPTPPTADSPLFATGHHTLGIIHSPLRLAIRRSNIPMVALLLNRGANPNQSLQHFGSMFIRDDLTPLKEAIHVGKPEIVKLLIEAGAPVQESSIGYVWTDSGKYSRSVGVEPTDSHDERQRKYDAAVADGWLIKVDIEEANEFGPMAKAIYAGRAAVVEVLLQAGADPNVSIGGKTTPLHLAVESGHPGIVKLLIDAGADINKPNAQGHKPLGVGYYKGDIADMLMAVGAKLKLKADQGAAEPQKAEPAEPIPDWDTKVKAKNK